jgi:hypothetical protein
MSWSFTAEGGTRFMFNGDMSGDVTIYRNENDVLDFMVPGKDLIEFIADYVRREKITELENATIAQILGLRVAKAKAQRNR